MSMELVERHFSAAALYWRDIYREQSVHGAIYRQRAAAILEYVDQLGLEPGANVAEIGCGAGFTSVALASRELLVDVVDVAPEMLRLARESARAQGVAGWMSFRQGDVHQLDLPRASYDLVVAVGVLEWMPALALPLARLARLLRPGGHLIVNVDNSAALHCLLDPRKNPLLGPAKRLALRFLPPAARPSRCSRARLDRALAGAGLLKVASRTCGFGPFTLFGCDLLPASASMWLHDKLQASADRGMPALRYGGETYLVLGRKPALPDRAP